MKHTPWRGHIDWTRRRPSSCWIRRRSFWIRLLWFSMGPMISDTLLPPEHRFALVAKGADAFGLVGGGAEHGKETGLVVLRVFE